MTSQTKRRWQFGLRWMFVAPILWGLGWWWVTLPRRTAERFVEQIGAAESREDVYLALGVPSDGYVSWANDYKKYYWIPDRLVSLERSLLDIVLGRRDFEINAGSMMGASLYFSFRVERTRVVVPPIVDLDGGSYFPPRGDPAEHLDRHIRNQHIEP